MWGGCVDGPDAAQGAFLHLGTPSSVEALRSQP